MTRRGYPKPQNLAAKLFTIRCALGLSQSQMAHRIKFYGHYSRISEFESGRRQPGILVLLAYARAANIPLEHIVDDDMDLQIINPAN